MPRRATIRFVSLKSCLVNLPISVYGPLVGRQVRPQSLAVHLTTITSDKNGKPISAYVGWTGMAAASSLAMWNNSKSEGHLETLEMDPQFAASLGFSEGDTVEIGLLHDLPVAKSVGTEPLTADDWEILELHAEYVEHNLLSQVRVACIGQEVDVWVLGRTRIRFRVVSVDPDVPAVLLSANSEVSIAPKSRSAPEPKKGKSKANGIAKPTLETQTDTSPISPTPPKDKKTASSTVIRILPSRIITIPSDQTPPHTTFWVSQDSFKSITGAQDFDPKDPPVRYVSIKRLRPPAAITSSAPAAPPSSPSTPAPTILRAADPTTSTQASKTEETTESKPGSFAQLLCSSSIVDFQGVLSPVTGDVDGAGDWDLISVIAIPLTQQKEIEQILCTNISAPTAPSSATSPVATLAGVESILTQSQEYFARAFTLQGRHYQNQGSTNEVTRLPGLLLCGAPGSGRTSIAKEIARRLEIDTRAYTYTVYIDLAKLGEERVGTLRGNFKTWLTVATWHRPSILILDNLDRAVAAEVEHADSFRSRQLAECFIATFGATRLPLGVAILATCQSQSSLHPLLASSHMFSSRVTLKAPDKNARRDILTRIVQDKLRSSDMKESEEDPLNYVALATQTEGYSATDLRDLVGRAVHQAALRSSKQDVKVELLSEDFSAAQVDFVPLTLRDVKLQKSEVQWSDIGGLHETRKVLRETLEWPTKYAAIFAKCPLRLRSGLLLYGYPGCGKTLLASAVAKECGLNFISVKGPELLNKYIGASEKSVRDLFDRASAAKPCILFFDEFDSIAPKRGHDSTGVTDRVVNQLLTQMDGAEGLDGVYVLAATSRPDLIDPALLRPGRLDKSLLCNMPDEQERLEILQTLSSKIPLSPSIDLRSIAARTSNYSGADLQAMVYNAHLEIVHESISGNDPEESSTANGSSKLGDGEDVVFTELGAHSKPSGSLRSRAEESALKRRIELMLTSQKRQQSQTTVAQVRTKKQKQVLEHHLERALSTTKPSVPDDERRRLDKIYSMFVAERSGQLPVPPEVVAIGSRASLG
ncbi:Peroxisome biosynthesis protein pex1 [Tulasnella sp. 419]|nr:Peroxisome biosynthesis protein pex1 [Tulasnella sp. 419]